MLALIFAAVVAQTETVTFTHPCAHSSIVLEAFGKQIGETIRPSGSVNKDYFLVRFHEMPIVDAKAAIAKTLNATWRTRGDVLYLTRTRAQELAEENAINEELRKSIQLTIDAAIERNNNRKPIVLSEVVEKLRDYLPDGPAGEYVWQENAMSRFQDRIAATFDVQDIMRLPLGSTFFSDNDQLRSQPLRSEWAKPLEVFQYESEIWKQAIKIADPSNELNLAYIFNQQVDHVMFEFERRADSFSVSDEYISRSATFGGGFAQATGIRVRDNEWRSFYKDEDDPAVMDTDLLAAWSGDSMFGEVRHGGWRWGTKKRRDVPRMIADMIGDLAGNEPLTNLVSWPILECAERKKTNIVALFDDRAILWAFDVPVRDAMPLNSVFGVRSDFMASFDDELECWIARPHDPVGARERRMDRQAFGNLLKTTRENGWVSLDDLAAFTRQTGNKTLAPSWRLLLDIAEFTQNTSVSLTRRRPGDLATAIYAYLPVGHRKRAWNGGTEIPLEFWPREVRKTLLEEDWGRWRLRPPRLDPRTGAPSPGRRISIPIGRHLPDNSTLRVEVEQKTMICLSTGLGGVQTDAEGYAELLVNPDPKVPTTFEFDRVAAGHVEVLTVILTVPNIGSMTLTAEYSRIPFFDELGPVKNLPASAQAAIAAAIERALDGGR